jgi:hypothetical protein
MSILRRILTPYGQAQSFFNSLLRPNWRRRGILQPTMIRGKAGPPFDDPLMAPTA